MEGIERQVKASGASPSRLVVRVLGPIGAARAGQEGALDVGGARPRRLLAALAIEAGQVVAVDRLAERIWGDRLPADPRGALYTLVARLRHVLGADVIVTTGPGYRLDAGYEATRAALLDSARFEDLLGRAEDPGLGGPERLQLLETALALWTGPAFDGLADEDWARSEAERLQERRAVAMERRVDAMLAAGKDSEALVELTAAVGMYPLRDRLVGQQMLALFRAGRQAEAARAFQAHRARLATDIGLEPGRDLADLDRRIVAGDPSLHVDAAKAQPDRALRGYRIGERLGEGAFAVVFRGTQPSVGRDVAIKVIRAELANRPEFVRRFEAEAHLVAHLEHPHIVPLYDYWREPGRACLVFRFLRGGSLESGLASRGPLDVEEARTMVTQVGGALSTAHRAGVVHRDVKPANVFLDGEGNYYLGDFGIALGGADLADPAAALSAGSPAYAAPEQLRREPIGPTADVHGLAITVFEALTGRLPFPDTETHAELLQRQLHDAVPALRDRRQDVPPALDEVMARATAKRPEDRFPDVEAFAQAFEAAFGAGPIAGRSRRGAATVIGVEARNPYKGLRPFTEADAANFRGRARLVDRLVASLSRPDVAGRVVAVVGPSGIGKSSVVRAGLLPALRRGAVAGSNRWFVAAMLPGREPFDELAAALLRVSTRAPVNLTAELTQDQRGLSRVVKALVPEGGGDLLLVIDQFEELFTLCDDVSARRRFLDALEYAVTDPRCPLRVVLTLRADFYDRPLRHGAFARLIEPSTVAVTALAPDELEAAVVEPAAAAGCEFEPGLVSEIVADVGDQPGALPLLQYALTELYERRLSGLLTRDAYRAVGGVAGALAGRAEELTTEASEPQRVALRRLFGHLVNLGEGTEDTRRRVTLTALGAAPETERMIERFGAARLLSFDRDPVTREPTVEVSHEALIRQWPRLRGWLDADRDDLRIHRHLSDATAAWERSGRDEGELYRGARLDAALDWLAAHDEAPTADERAFLAASRARRDAEAARERRHVRRLRSALGAVGIIAALAVVASVLALVQQRSANRNAARARSESAASAAARAQAEDEVARRTALQKATAVRGLVAESKAAQGQNLSLALLLAAEANGRSDDVNTRGGLQSALVSNPRLLAFAHSTAGYGVGALSADGTTYAVPRADGALEVFETTELRARREPIRLDGPVANSIVGLTSDGSLAVVGAAGGPLDVWDLASGVKVRHLMDRSNGRFTIDRQDRLLVGRGSDVVAYELRRAAGSEPVVVAQGLAAPVLSVAVAAATGQLAVIDSSFAVHVLAGDGTGPTNTFPSGLTAGAGADLTISPDGARVVVSAGAQAAPLLDVGSGARLAAWTDHSTPTYRFSADGSLLMSVGGDGTAHVREPRTGALREGPIRLFVGIASTLAISPDSRQAIVSSIGGHTVLVDLVGRSKLGRPLLPPFGPVTLSLSHDGRTVAIAAKDGSVTLVDVPSGRRLAEPLRPPGTATFPFQGFAVAFSPDDRFAAFGGATGAIHVYEVATGRLDRSLPYPASPTTSAFAVGLGEGATKVVESLDWSPDGRTIAAGSWEEAYLLDVETGAVRATADGFKQLLWRLTFSPDGATLAAASFDGTAWLIDSSTGQKLGEPLGRGDFAAISLEWRPDGQAIAVWNGAETTIKVIDVESRRQIGPTIPTGGQPRFSPDGATLVVMTGQGIVVVDVASGRRIGDPIPFGANLFAAGIAHRDGRSAVTAGSGPLTAWDLEPTSWRARACAAAGRNLTRDEWQQFVPDEPYGRTCAEWPEPPGA